MECPDMEMTHEEKWGEPVHENIEPKDTQQEVNRTKGSTSEFNDT